MRKQGKGFGEGSNQLKYIFQNKNQSQLEKAAQGKCCPVRSIGLRA